MRLCSIASGSSGNCIYVGSEATHLLVDVGISGKRTESGLRELGLAMGDIDGILVTHEHADHISGLGVIVRKYEIPVYATGGTIKAMRENGSLGVLEPELFHEVGTLLHGAFAHLILGVGTSRGAPVASEESGSCTSPWDTGFPTAQKKWRSARIWEYIMIIRWSA